MTALAVVASLLAATATVDVQPLFGAPLPASAEPTVPSAPALPAAAVATTPQAPMRATQHELPLAAMGMTLLVILAGTWALWRRRRVGLRSHPLIRRIAQAGIAPGQGLAVVEVGEEILVVSTGNGGVRLIHRLSPMADVHGEPEPEDRNPRRTMSAEEMTLRAQFADLLAAAPHPTERATRPSSSQP